MKKDDIVETVLTFLSDIINDLDKYCYTFLIIDTNGVIKYSYSNNKNTRQYCSQSTSWTEEQMGHNAVSLAMKSRRLAYVHKKEHTNPFLQQHFSIAAPFYNEEPKIEGYLAFLSTESVDVNMTIGMFNASIKFIESQYKVNSALEKLEKEAKIEDAIIKSIYDGFLVLSPDGTITHANHKAASWLGKSIEELIGRKLSEFVLSPLHVMEVFKTGRPMIDKELFVKLHNKTLHIYKTAVPVHDEQGRVVAAINLNKEIKEVRNLVNQMVGAKASFFFKDIIYKSKQMAETVKIAEDAARCPLSVLIQGESGTGKELFAHAIHNASVRKNGPFIIIDCASIPHELVESELFGFVEGSFTGARKGGRTGKFELANGGTIFLDEIGEMPLDSQAKFLRVLQGHSITRVGGTESIPINIRVIAATNRDLKEEVKKKNFREDLYYRLNVLTIEIPPLRIRIEDVEELVQFVLRKYEEKLGKKDVSFSKEAMEILKQYHWPGNVRELENTVVRAINLCEKVILPEHVSINNSFASFRPVAVPKCMSYRELEKQNIIDTLKINNGNRAKTAKMLGIARSTLYSKIKYFNM